MIDKHTLEQLYIVEKKSLQQIGKMYGKSIPSISQYLKKCGIPARPFSTKGLRINVGIPCSDERKRNISLANTGKKHTLETKKILSQLNSGAKNSFYGKKHNDETRKKISLLATGRRYSDERRKRVSGKNSSQWKGGITPINKLLRTSVEYKLWRKAVFERDNFTCIWCGTKGGNGKSVILNADHIKPFAYYPELRFAIDNGRTLCVDCHHKTDTFGNRARKFKI